MTLDRKTIVEIAEELRGQCVHDLDDVLHERGIEPDSLTLADHGAIDELVFLCEECNWWCGADEMADNDEDSRWVCEECWGDR